MGLLFVDTHCHLNFQPLVGDLERVLERAALRGVTRIIVPTYDLASFDTIEEMAVCEGLFPAFGLHPWVADQPLDLAQLKARLERTTAVAIGEIGLDFKIDEVSRERQLVVFREQLDLAATLDLPVLLHCRGAFEELLAALQACPVRGVLHAFSRGPELAQRVVEIGLHVAFGGAITRPKATRARKSARTVPLERILLETDAPSIGLETVQPERVEPHHVADIAHSLALLRGRSVDDIAKETTANAEQLFRLPGSTFEA